MIIADDRYVEKTPPVVIDEAFDPTRAHGHGVAHCGFNQCARAVPIAEGTGSCFAVSMLTCACGHPQ